MSEPNPAVEAMKELDGLHAHLIEKAREISGDCGCEKCQAIRLLGTGMARMNGMLWLYSIANLAPDGHARYRISMQRELCSTPQDPKTEYVLWEWQTAEERLMERGEEILVGIVDTFPEAADVLRLKMLGRLR